MLYIIFDQYFSDNVEQRLGRSGFIWRIFLVFLAYAASIFILLIFSYLITKILSMSDRTWINIVEYIWSIIAIIWWYPIIFLVRKRAHDYGSSGISFTIQVIMIMLTLTFALGTMVFGGKHSSPDANFWTVIWITFIYLLQIITLLIGCLLHSGDKSENIYWPPPKS